MSKRWPIPATKVCSRCGKEKPFTAEFFPPCGPKARNLAGLYPACRECNNAKRREWGREHPDRERLSRRAYRLNHGVSRRTSAGHHLVGYKTLESMFEEQGGRCKYCGVALDDSYHIDHVIPLARGGTHERSNLVLSCAPCNLSKNRSTIEEWLKRCPNALTSPQAR